MNRNVYVLSHPPTPPSYICDGSKCVYVYVHYISLFLSECACTTIIDISP